MTRPFNYTAESVANLLRLDAGIIAVTAGMGTANEAAVHYFRALRDVAVYHFSDQGTLFEPAAKMTAQELEMYQPYFEAAGINDFGDQELLLQVAGSGAYMHAPCPAADKIGQAAHEILYITLAPRVFDAINRLVRRED